MSKHIVKSIPQNFVGDSEESPTVRFEKLDQPMPLESHVDTVHVEVKPVEIFATKVAERPKTVKYHDFNDLKLDLDRNPRFKGTYTDSSNLDLARSIHLYGLQEMPVVNVRTDGTVWVLKGHRRIKAIETLRNDGVPSQKNDSSKVAIPADVKYSQRLQCITYSGLTPDEEMDLVMDHGLTKLLTDAEKFVAACNMASLGYSHKMIADKIGIARTHYTNTMAKLMRLPDCARDAFMNAGLPPEKRDPKLPVLTWESVRALHDQHEADQKLPGAKMKEAGPEFNKKWEKIVTEGNEPTEKMLSKEKLKDLVTNLNRSTGGDVIDLVSAIIKGNMLEASNAIGRIVLSIDRKPVVTMIEEGIAHTVGDVVTVE